MKKRLIITADDFGYSKKRNKGIVECYLAGGITRASLIVNAEACQDAVQLAIQHSIPLGLHLNLTEGYPLSPKEDVFTLLDSDGTMLGKAGFRDALRDGFIDLQEVALEMHAQIKRFNEVYERTPIHVDGHMHVHVLPGTSTVFASVLREHGILETRLPVELSVEHCDWLIRDRKEFCDTVVRQAKVAAKDFDREGLKYANGFVGMVTMGTDMTTNRLTSLILDAFTCTKRSDSAAYLCANYTSTRSIAQGSHTQRDCDTSGCERLEASSREGRHDSAAAVDIKPDGENNVTDDSKSAYCDKVQSVQKSSSVDSKNRYDSDQPVTIELMVHPGYPSESGDLGCGTGVDNFACSPARKHELDIVNSKDLLEWYKKQDITLVATCVD